MPARYQKYRLKWPITATQWINVDEMLSEIFTDLNNNAGLVFQGQTIGDIIYADTSSSFARLPDVVLGNALLSGGVATPPFWGKIDLTTTVSGILPVSSGGTGAASLTDHGVLVGQGTSPIVATSVGSTNTVLHGNTALDPTFSQVVEDDILLSNVATNNATIAKHGFLSILPNNASQFLNGQGNFAIPGTASITTSYLLVSFSGQTSVNVVHNFGTYPLVQVLTSTSLMVPLTVVHNTLNDFTVTFFSSTTGSIIATLGSPQPQSLVVVSSPYTVLSTDRIVKVTSAAITITLPTAVGNTGREFNIDNASTGSITVDADGTETIENEFNQVVPSNSAMTVYSDGSGWRII